MSRVLLRDLMPGHTYNLQVRAVSDTDSGEWSQNFSITTDASLQAPDIPAWAAVGAFVPDGSAFIATWQPLNMSLEQNLDFSHYELELTAASKSVVFKTTNTFFTLTLEENRNLWSNPQPVVVARLRSVDLTGNASAWNASTLTATNPAPTAPTTITGTVGVDQIALTWNASVDDDVIGYRVHVGSTSGFTPSAGNKVFDGNSLSFSYTTTTYSGQWFKVAAVDVFGQVSATYTTTASALTPVSPFTVDTTAPAVPTSLAGTITNNANGVGAIANLTWVMASPPSDLAGYYVRWRKVGTTVYNSITFDKDALSGSVVLNDAYANHEFQIRAFDWQNNYSAYSGTLTVTSPANATPTAVSGLTSTPNRDSMRYAWTASTDADLKNYEVTFSTSPTFASGNLTFLTGTANYLDIGGLIPGTTYYARVRANDTGGLSSAFSATDTKATLAYTAYTSDGAAPTASPTATVTGGIGYLYVQWPAQANADPVTYEVYISTTTGFTPSGVTKVAETTATNIILEKDAAAADLVYGTTYYIKLIAKDRDGSAAAGTQGSASPLKVTSVDSALTATDVGAPTTAQFATAVKTYVNEYYLSTSESTPTGGTWSTTSPTRTPGTFIWIRTVVTYQDNSTSTTAAALLTGNTGAAGTPASTVDLTATSQVLSVSAGGTITPTTTTVTGTPTNTTIANAESLTSGWSYGVDGGAFSTTIPAGVSRTGNVVTITGSTMTAKTIAVRAIAVSGVADTLTVAKVSDGATGGTGGTGPAGADAYTVLLTNEAQTIAAGTTNANAGTFTTNVNAYKGATAQTVTVGTITGGATGISAAVTNNNTTNPLITFTVTTALTTANGTFSILVTVAGITFTQIWSWSLSFTGSTGAAGTNGIGITGTVVDYQIGSSGTTAPTGTWLSTPQATSPGQFLWTRTVTSYTSGSPTTAYSVAAHGTTGATGNNGIGISGTVVDYQVGSSGTTAPTGTWLSTPQATTTGQFLWTRTVTSYTSGSPTTAYAVSAHGSTGATGNTGPQGISISSVTPYFQTVTPIGAAAPALPTTNPPGGSWVATEPAYAANTELYRTERIVYSNSTFAYTAVTKVSAYTAAAAAQTTADGKNKIIRNTAAPSSTSGYVDGDLWFQYTGTNLTTGTITGQWLFASGAWVQQTIRNEVIGNLDAGKLTTGFVSAAVIQAASIDVTKLQVTDFTNYIADPYFQQSTNANAMSAGTIKLATDPTVPTGAPYPGVLSAPTTFDIQTGYFTTANPGDEFYVEAWAANTGAGAAATTMGIRAYSTDKTAAAYITVTAVGSLPISLPVSTTWTKMGGKVTVPSTVGGKPVGFVQFWLRPANTAGWNYTGWVVQKRYSGKLIVDGSIEANKITAGTYAGGVFEIGAGGILRTSNSEVQITNSGISVTGTNSSITATALTTGTFQSGNVLTVNGNMALNGNMLVQPGGYIKSTDYTGTTQAAGSTTGGWYLGEDGLRIVSGIVAADSLAPGTFGGTNNTGTINIAANAIIQTNGGAIKSNTFNGTFTSGVYNNNATAGYYLDSTNGLIIATGKVTATALVTGTVSTASISLTSSGEIKSGGYVDGTSTNGFRLTSTGLEIPNGSIQAAKLVLQDGVNLMQPTYADFEQKKVFAGNWWVSGNLYNVPSSGGLIFDVGTSGKFNSQSLATVWTTNTLNPILYLGKTDTDYNIPVSAGETYIFSMYAWCAGTVATNLQMKVKWSNGTTATLTASPSMVTSATLSASGTAATATRFAGYATAPAGVTGAVIFLESSTLTANAGYNIDGVQCERKGTSVLTPSPWKPGFNVTSIDGSQIRTGSINSVNYSDNNPAQPMWSINTNGSATFTELQILGNAVVGLPGDTLDNVTTVASANFIQGSTGWRISSNGVAEFRQLVTGSLSPTALGSGELNADATVTLKGAIESYGPQNRLVTITGAPTGGTFTFTSTLNGTGSSTSAAIAFNASASTVQTALQAITGFSTATVTGAAGGPWRIAGTSSSDPYDLATTSSLTGGTSPAVTITELPRLTVGMSSAGFYSIGPDSNDMPTPYVLFPTTGGAPNIISGVLEATTLNVNGDVNGQSGVIAGTMVLDKGAIFNLASIVPAPSSAPTVTVDYENYNVTLNASRTYASWTVGHDGALYSLGYYTASGGTGITNGRFVVRRFDPNTNVATTETQITDEAVSWTTSSSLSVEGSYRTGTISGFNLTYIPSLLGGTTGSYAIVYRDSGTARNQRQVDSYNYDNVYLRVFNTSFADVWGGPQNLFAPRGTQSTITVGRDYTDGTKLMVSWRDAAAVPSAYKVRRYTAAAGGLLSVSGGDVTVGTSSAMYNVGLIGFGAFDTGANRYAFYENNTDQTKQIYFWNGTTPTTQDSVYNFLSADGQQFYGVTWNTSTSKFEGLGLNSKRYIYQGGSNMWTTGGTSSFWRFKYSWWDSVGTNYETARSGIATSTMKKRARISVTTTKIPYDSGATDTPNRARIYRSIDGGAYAYWNFIEQPGQTYTLSGQVTSNSGVEGSGGAAFPATGVPGKITGTNLSINGDGSATINSLTVNNVATLTGSAWTAITGFTTVTAVAGQTPEYRKDAAGCVYIRGAVNRNTYTSGASTIFNMPSGFRPQGASAYGVVRSNTVGTFGTLLVDTSGNAQLLFSGTAQSAYGLEMSYSSLA